jgi:large repetitive protein
MLRSTLSSWFGFSGGQKKKKSSASTGQSRRNPGRRTLRMEHLEGRELLSLSAIAATSSGVASASATATVASSDPTVSAVVASSSQNKLTWSAVDANGIASSSLTVAGVAVSNVSGPWSGAYGSNYSWSCGSLSTGTYAYVITAIDVLGNSSQYTGTLTVGSSSGPTISKVAAAPGQEVISWNAKASSGTASCSLSLDGATVTDVYGPWTSSTGASYQAAIGSVSDGVHTYIITATDSAGKSSTYTGWFTVGTTTPTINDVVLAANQGTITWNADAVTGISASTLAIDSVSVSNISGPYDATSGVNYLGTFGTLASGNHTYTITATSRAGVTTKTIGVFAVSGPSIGNIVVSTSTGYITWNAASSVGIASSSLTIDGDGMEIYGAYAASSGTNFSSALGSLSSGSHTYVISAIDSYGRYAKYSGMFKVTNLSPIISKAAVSVAKKTISWNVYDTDVLQSVTITLDGVSKTVLGPYKAATGYNYQTATGTLKTGSHTYVIRAVDSNGNTTKYTGTFTV